MSYTMQLKCKGTYQPDISGIQFLIQHYIVRKNTVIEERTLFFLLEPKDVPDEYLCLRMSICKCVFAYCV